ncbi:Na+-transporting methylmalonyl-CoA/oxaloacetate decarboxylase gamma subunit [Thalassospira sp. MBR-102]|jgi:hypothetical protein|uniref:TM2 domain-containing protein n=2 Tax=Thalassospira TaxID=168934 RepID=A0ABR5XYJ7_9PROT|nr:MULTISPECIES: hypothetical protein [Thalassospira]MBR9780649.1 hypothetical protein [Rhodospirillales bacterium]KEO50378.1 hypothetical protein SMB34_10465 [Thalassospira permensis NBRC 106175]KZC99571.1 hypothetical protein AUP40_03365 [Thalassospira xiamenensis]KZD06728.1 hypothetical protein AUP45_19545 [Thalassospira xiamenensis]MAB35649.1 hypothetical protein [Thalassospira sp.]|tara:strand:+ start:1017 stop:1214 length:198 start_codon:yes stop_codon:yes gene_type:complete
MHLILIVIYLLACIVCGMLGRRTSFGFLGHFLLAIVITPIGDFLVQIVARPSRELREKLKDLDYE